MTSGGEGPRTSAHRNAAATSRDASWQRIDPQPATSQSATSQSEASQSEASQSATSQSAASQSVASRPAGAQSGSAPRTRARELVARVAYWSPVLAVLVLFAQIAFLGLRPAMAEARRLAEAEVMLRERHNRAAAENAVVSAHIAARHDPIFRERQRRARLIQPAAAQPAATPDDGR